MPTPARLQALLELIIEAGGATLDPAKDEQARFALTRGSTKEAAVYSTGRSVLHAGKAPAYDELSALIDRALEGLGGGDGECRAQLRTPTRPPDTVKRMPRLASRPYPFRLFM